MIARLEKGDEKAFRALLAGERCTGARIAAALDAWGLDAKGCAFYRVDDTGALLVQGASALLCGAAGDTAELEAFLAACGAKSFLSERVFLDGWRALPRLLMGRRAERADGQETPPLPAGCETRPDLWALAHSGLIGAEPDAYYADVRRKVNAKRAAVWAVRGADGAYIATAGVYALTGTDAYLSAVATRADMRGRGLASALVDGLCAALAPRRIYLLCATGMRAFYEKRGFSLVTPICEFVPPDASQSVLKYEDITNSINLTE